MQVRTVFGRSRFLDPVRQMSDEVKEEISLWDADHLQDKHTSDSSADPTAAALSLSVGKYSFLEKQIN